MKDSPYQAIFIYKWERCHLTLKGSPIINVGVRQWIEERRLKNVHPFTIYQKKFHQTVGGQWPILTLRDHKNDRKTKLTKNNRIVV